MLARTISHEIFQQIAMILNYKNVRETGRKNMKEIKVVELFGGIGSIMKAMINLKINFKVLDYVEKDANAVKSYNALYNENYIPKDIRCYSLPDEEIDILMHGSPCQDISIAGKMEGAFPGSGTRSSLLWETVRIVSECKRKPQIIIWENVQNVLSKNFEFIFYDYLDELSNLGYTSSWKVLSPIDFGIPQTRPRLFCVSARGNTKFNFSNLKNLPMKNLDDFLEENPGKQFIISETTIRRLKKYHRLRIIDKYAYTITTKQACNYIGYIRVKDDCYRSLSTIEVCRLMGFSDDDFKVLSNLHTTKQNQISTILHRQFGNAIVVNILEAIIYECKRSILT